MNDAATHIKFAPMLYCKNVAAAIEFYKQAFDAKEIRRFSDDDGSVHVAELTIQDAMFHLHEESKHKNELSPETLNGTSVVIGLFTDDVDAFFNAAIKAGATEVHAPQDYEYGMRQAYINDPSGHHWQIQKFISQ